MELSPWHGIGALARLAPTPHNTQPFRIRPRADGGADLLLVCERLLPDEDPGNAYVTSAFGVFAVALEHAGRAHGHRVTVSPVPELDAGSLPRTGIVVLGDATLAPTEPIGADTELIKLRRTSRTPYHATPVAPAVLDYLHEVAAAGGQRLSIISEPTSVRAMLRMNAEAIVDNLQNPAEREEVRRWYRLGPTPIHGDGLWQQPMNQPAWQLELAFGAPRVLALPLVRDLAIANYLRTQRGTQHVAVIEGPFATWPERVAAGRALFALWLAMTETNVYMHPFGSMLTNAHYAAWLTRTFSVPDTWLVFRLGHSDPPPEAPRLASIVVQAVA
ncbi:MAG: hypothetical protein ACKV2T_02875 [Kofleriaceae bacterium]